MWGKNIFIHFKSFMYDRPAFFAQIFRYNDSFLRNVFSTKQNFIFLSLMDNMPTKNILNVNQNLNVSCQVKVLSKIQSF